MRGGKEGPPSERPRVCHPSDPGGGGIAGGGRVPPVLRSAYPRIATLEQTIRDACAHLGRLPALTMPGDPAAYSDWLLRRTFASVHARAPKLPPSTSFEQLSSLDEVLARALSQHFRASAAPNNVLCYGVRRRRPDAHRRSSGAWTSVGGGGANNPDPSRDPRRSSTSGPAAAPVAAVDDDADARVHASRARWLSRAAALGVEATCHSAALDALMQPPWATLLERAGDAVLLHLLAHASVFVPLDPNATAGGSHLQVCGAPVSAVARGARRACVPRGAPPAKPKPGGGTGRGGGRRAEGTGDTRRGPRANAEGGRSTAARLTGAGGRAGGRGTTRERRGTRGGRERWRGKGVEDEAGSEGPCGYSGATASADEDEGDDDGGARASNANVYESPIAALVNRARGFVRGVMTANPFMRAACPSKGDEAAAAPAQPDGVTTIQAGSHGQARGIMHGARESDETPGTLARVDVVMVPESGPPASGSCDPQDATVGSGMLHKPPRPSSWRRKKAAKAKATAATKASATEAARTSAGGRGDARTVPERVARRWTSRRQRRRVGGDASEGSAEAGSAPPSAVECRRESAIAMQWDKLGAAATTAGGTVDPWNKLGAAGAAASTPAPPTARNAKTSASKSTRATSAARGIRAGDVTFGTAAFMHKSSYSRLPGLPRQHPLNASGRGTGAARRLYMSIFGKGEPAASVGSKGASGRSHAVGNGAGRGVSARLATARCAGAAAPGASAPLSKPKTKKKASCARRIPLKHRRALLPLLSVMLLRAARCPYARILNHHCPMPAELTYGALRWSQARAGNGARGVPGEPEEGLGATDGDGATEGAHAAKQRSLLASFTPPRAVASFLWATICRIVPREMLGGLSSRAALRRFILRLVVLRRFEQCTLHEAMARVKTKEFPWLFGKTGPSAADDSEKSNDGKHKPRVRLGGPASGNASRRRHLQQWVRWLIAELAIPLLRAHFYCTETEAHRLRVFYFRKGVWARLTAAHLAAMTEDPGNEARRVRYGMRNVEGDGGTQRTHGQTVSRGNVSSSSAPMQRSDAVRMDDDGPDAADVAEGAPGAIRPSTRAAYRRLPRRRARIMLMRHLLGFARLRLLPKSTGLRPVAMLGRPAVASFKTLRSRAGGSGPEMGEGYGRGGGRGGGWRAYANGNDEGNAASGDAYRYMHGDDRRDRSVSNRGGERDVLAFRPVNASLQGVFDVLKYEAWARPEVMGANVSDYRDVHRRLGPFIRGWRASLRQRSRQRRRQIMPQGQANGDESKTTDPEGAGAGRRAISGADAVDIADRPFIVAADVKGAFDSIPLPALEQVVTALVGSGEYSVARMSHVQGGVVGGVRTKTKRVAAPSAPGMEAVPAALTALGRRRGGGDRGNDRASKERRVGGVLIDLASPQRLHRAQVLELLHEHLRRNIVRSGGVYLLQTVGIPQGSVLSTLLCSMFYAHLEATHSLSGGAAIGDGSNASTRDTSVLCRWTDDLLHISATRAPAEGFLSAALAGFAEYGCSVNTNKTSLNFDFTPSSTSSGCTTGGAASPTPQIPRREVMSGGGRGGRRCIAWCGLLIDSENLELRVDYARYAGDWAREAVTVPGRLGSGAQSPFAHLGRRVVAYLRPKCTALLYDHSINSPLTARLNVYQSFLLAAIKLHCFIGAASERPHGGSSRWKAVGEGVKSGGGGSWRKTKCYGSPRRGTPSPAVVHAAVHAGVRYMEGAVRHNMAVARATLGARGRIQRSHIRYLGLRAFAVILARKQSRHVGTLRLLAKDLSLPSMRAAARRLAPVVDDTLSIVFNEIRF